MRVTVCQLPDGPDDFASAWADLVAHVRAGRSDLVLLPEMPFSPWFGAARTFDAARWANAVEAHQLWMPRMAEMGSAAVLGTRPVDSGPRRLNEAFVREAPDAVRAVHAKSYLPNEEGVWEASWYHAAPRRFTPFEIRGARAGFLVCTEIWAMEEARRFGEQGVELIFTPRLTMAATLDKWLAAGRVAAVVSGAFSLSSNRIDETGAFGGQGWIVGPDGDVLAVTSIAEPFVTLDLDLGQARDAKRGYPRYILNAEHVQQ